MSNQEFSLSSRRVPSGILCLAEGDRRYRGTYCLYHEGDEAASTTETSVYFYKTIRRIDQVEYHLVHVDGATLCLRTAATNGSIVLLLDDTLVCRARVE
jgi:hypothetical protein